MKLNHRLILLAGALSLLTWTGLQAADPKDDLTPVVAAPPEDNTPVAQEFVVESSYTGSSAIKQGDTKLGNVSSINSHFNYVASPQVSDGYLIRVGVDGERNSFGLFNNAPLPTTLQSINAIIGADLALSDKILLRAELHPGIYSDFVHVGWRDFDVPVQIGGTYLWSKDFQLIFGLQIDVKSNYPIIGLPGFRWQFADNWVLSAIPPKPRLEYELNNSVTLYAGAELLGGTYQLNDAFGTSHGHGPGSPNSQFNNNVADYAEVRTGVGVSWKFTPNLKLDVSGGYIPYREFAYHADRIGFDSHSTRFHNNLDKGAPYAEVGLSGSF